MSWLPYNISTMGVGRNNECNISYKYCTCSTPTLYTYIFERERDREREKNGEVKVILNSEKEGERCR